MKTRCSELWEAIVALAEGQENPAAREHVNSCPGCAKKLAQMQRLFDGLKQPMIAAPADLVDQAKAIFPNRKPFRIAGLITSTVGAAGARSAVAADNFQVLYESDDVQARLLYRQDAGKWEVTGRVNEGSWQAEAGGKKLKVTEDGRFHFSVKNLGDSEIRLIGEEFDILIPSGEEARSGGS